MVEEIGEAMCIYLMFWRHGAVWSRWLACLDELAGGSA
jgi:hypothetical protein